MEISKDVRHSQVSNYKMFRKRKRISLYDMTKDEVRRFCLETGMHGFQYIARPENTPTERFIWTFISFGALLTALILSTLSWVHSSTNPTLVVTDSMQEPIANFYYPAISLCSLNKISKRKLLEFIKNHTLEDETYWKTNISLLVQMYFSNHDTSDSYGYNELQNRLEAHNLTAEEALVAITPSCKTMMQSCMWKGRKIRCDRLFQATRTPEGTCCTFNHYALKNRTFDGYMADRYQPYPRKVVSCGQMSGIKILVKNEPNNYVASEIPAYGTKILIHDPYDYPDWGAHRVLVPMGRQIYADINPTHTYATDDLKSMSISKRKCVLKNERNLKIFANYSYLNCLTECRINIVGNVCGCMPFYFRNEWGQSLRISCSYTFKSWNCIITVRTVEFQCFVYYILVDWTPKLRMCSLRDVACLSHNKQRYMSSEPGYDTFQTKTLNHEWGTEKGVCDCMVNCESREYIMQSTMGKLSTKQLSNNKQFFGTTTNVQNYSVISIFFKDLSGTRNKRDASFTWVSIFGLFGGLLGLCLGFSFIAVLDVIYTFTLRLGINYMRKKKEMKQVKHEIYDSRGFNVLPLVNDPVKLKSFSRGNNKYPLGSDVWFIN